MISGVKVKNSLTEANVDPRNIEHTKLGEEMLDVLSRFKKIEAKNKCLRVQFLDWLSDKLLDWSNRVHERSVKIDSPCVIKVEPRKKEESKSAKESKKVRELRERLQDAYDRQDKLREENEKLSKEAIESLTKKVDELLKDEK